MDESERQRIESLAKDIAMLTTSSEHMQGMVIEDKALLMGILKLLRGDEQGQGGFTGRILILEQQLGSLHERIRTIERLRDQEKQDAKKRQREVIGWVVGSGIGTAAFIRILSKLLTDGQ